MKADRVFKNVDGIKFLNHAGGCGGTRQDAAVLSKLLAAYADHPNVGGVTVLSLGCQNLQVQDFVNDLNARNPRFDKPLYIFEQQQSRSEEQLITAAIQQTFAGLIELNQMDRWPAPLRAIDRGGQVRRQRRLQRHQRQSGRGLLQRPIGRPER